MKIWHKEFISLLRSHYEEKKTADPKYSLRSLARDLGLSAGPTSALIKGTRSWDFSPEWALRVISKMNVKKDVETRFRVMMGVRDHSRSSLDENQMTHLLSRWYHSDVLTSFDLKPPYRGNVDFLSNRLGVSPAEIEESIQFLLEKGFLQRDGSGSICRSSDVVETADDISNEAIEKFHRENLALAMQMVSKESVKQREFQSITFSGSSAMMDELRKEIRSFSERVAVLMSKEQANDEIFHFSVQLFPVNLGGDKHA
jgi:uncharacterized protein (TIGR02147 family)